MVGDQVWLHVPVENKEVHITMEGTIYSDGQSIQPITALD